MKIKTDDEVRELLKANNINWELKERTHFETRINASKKRRNECCNCNEKIEY